MSLNFYYCKGDGFHAVIEERNEKFATEYFVYLMNEMLEPEKGITVKDVICEPVNIYNYKREEIVGEDLLDAISWMFAAKKSHPSLFLPAWVAQWQENRPTQRAVDVCQTCQDDDFCVGDYCPECGTRH